MADAGGPVAVEATPTDIGTTGARLFLIGSAEGTVGAILENNQLSTGVFRVSQLVIRTSAVGAPNISLTLAQSIDIPGALITQDKTRLKTTAELASDVGAINSEFRRQFLVLVAEAQRRLLTVEVDASATGMIFLGVDSLFGKDQAFAGAQIKLQLWAVAGVAAPQPIELALKAELAAYVHLKVGQLTRTAALVCLFEVAGEARLRLDADDLNLSLPEFKLPTFDLPSLGSLPQLDLHGGLTAAARAFQRLNPGLTASIERSNPANDTTRLALRVRKVLGRNRIDWALVASTFNPMAHWDPLQNLAEFKVNLNSPSGIVVNLNNVTLADNGAGPVVKGSVNIVGGTTKLVDGDRRLGPLEVSWRGVAIKPMATGFPLGGGVNEPNNATLRCEVGFERLVLRAQDDPDAVLAFSGRLELTPSGARIIELKLKEPYPLVLIARAVDGMARSAGAIARVLFDFAKAGAEQTKGLLDILGKMAAAVGRAAIFVADAAGDALEQVAGLVAKGLVAIAELLAEALKGIAQLAKDASTVLAVEVRVATDPFEVRQLLITPCGGNLSAGTSLNVLGVRLAIEPGWQPGLLIDVATQPGAYLILTRADPAPANPVATVSTDLWLRREQKDGRSNFGAVRDADGGKTGSGRPDGDRADEPLLGVTLQLDKPAQAPVIMIALAGLNRGRGIFFQRLAGDAGLAEFPLALPGNVKIKTAPGAFALTPIVDDFKVNVEFAKDRVLPLLGMGEPGKEQPQTGEPSFLDKLKGSLANVIWVKDTKTSSDLKQRTATINLTVGLKAAGLETDITLRAALSLDDLEVKIAADTAVPIVSRRIEERALGLVWVVEQTDEAKRLADAQVEMFQLGFGGGQSGFELNAGNARMELRFEGLSSDGKGVVFDVTTFKIGPGGLDLEAKVRDNPVRLNGIDVPFRFTAGRLEIKGGRLVTASIAGRGSLPPKLIGEADCTAALTFGEAAGEGIVLQAGKVELDKKGDPIICHATRFTLTVTDLDLSFVKDNGYHFFYLVTGTLRFTPKAGEFESGLLQYLDGVEINLERTPLSADPRVLLKHISFQKALNPKKSFNLFNLFTFELRGFGYHPAAAKFGGDPAVNISGQIKFVEIGDVMQPKIDFHGLWMAPPAQGQSLPRIKADGLGIDLNLKGSIRVRGTVLAVDPDTATVEGADLAPDGYKTYGFLGEGEFEIPGWGSMGASLGFLELERKDQPSEKRKSFFFYAEMRKLAIEIPAVIWTFYLREVGFGLGFRYTLEALSAADRANSIPRLIRALDDVSKRQGELHRYSAWRPEPDGDRVTLALKGAIQAYPASQSWNEAEEEAAENPFLFDLVAAIRSDFTLFMGLRGWIGTNYIDYLNNKEELRSSPGLRGYLYISAPQKRLLARMIGDSRGYIGDRIPALRKSGGSEPPLRRALRAVDWSATLFIKPGLFHYELGWPNQLVVRLIDEPNMRVTVRGGMIFRAADDGLLWGYNLEADAFFRFGGALQAGPVGIAAEASLDAHLLARVICYLSWRFKGSLVYGLVSLDATLAVSVRAWLDIDLRIKKFTIRIGFSVSLQFSAAIELVISTEGVGAHVDARVAISAFGCTLSISVGFTIGAGHLAEARARVQRFMAMSLTAEEPDAAPALAARDGDSRLDGDAGNAGRAAKAPAPPIEQNVSIPDKPSQRRAQFGRPVVETNFWLVLHQAIFEPGTDRPAPEDYAYALLIPKEPEARDAGGYTSSFYAAPTYVPDWSKRSERVYTFDKPLDGIASVQRWDAGAQKFVPFIPRDEVAVVWNLPIDNDDGDKVLTLAHLFDECFLSDTEWKSDSSGEPTRRTVAWCEPPPHKHKPPREGRGATEEARVADRDMAQKNRIGVAVENPYVDTVRQGRSTVMTMFLDQFVTLARTGKRASLSGLADVTDLGLVFYGPASELEALERLKISKHEFLQETYKEKVQEGSITVFNYRDQWFARQGPVLANGRSVVAADGVKLDWRLSMPFEDDNNPRTQYQEHFLHHYEIVRTIEGQEFNPRVLRVKPAATIGGREDDPAVTIDGGVASGDLATIELIHPDWQFVDDLADLPADLRRALLPTADESTALDAAIAWADRFGEDAVSVTYSVTPVDIAGTRGLPKSFLITINRPQPPIRAAEAELRFVVKAMGASDGAAHVSGDMPGMNLAVLLALKDTSFCSGVQTTSRDGRELLIRRYYRLIADPDDIRPSGHYGTDGLTERRLGPASGFGPTADEIVWLIAAGEAVVSAKPDDKHSHFVRFTDDHGKVPATTPLNDLECDLEVIAQFPRWRRLAGVTHSAVINGALDEKPPLRGIDLAAKDPGIGKREDFLQTLWQRDGKSGPRVATRFALQTVQQISLAKDGTVIAQSQSKRVPVAIEVRVEPWAGAGTAEQGRENQVGLLRPEAFEWPVHLDMPPLVKGQVRAETGFARFRVPPAQQSLAALIKREPLALVRDADRRVLTQVSFDAAASFGIKDDFALDAIHRSAVAGYDLHELDLDNLARLDTDAKTLELSSKTWRRARRVARVERVSPEMARLMPDKNSDWLGWQAHYPSETWRLVNRGNAKDNQAKPMRAAWFSAAESTLHFAERRLRIRLLPTAPEGAIPDLMAAGQPAYLDVSLVAAPGSRAETTLSANAGKARVDKCELGLFPLADDINPSPLILEPKSRRISKGPVKPPGDGSAERMTANDIRKAMLCLGWKPLDDQWWRDFALALTKDRAALEGLGLRIIARAPKVTWDGKQTGERITGEVVLPLALAGFHHPVLEEVIGGLAYSVKNTLLYRRYVVTVQAVQQGNAKDLGEFLSATAAEKDPFGWLSLQQLGLAATIQMYDRDTDRFVAPNELLARVNDVLCATLRRYEMVYGAAARNITSQPFVEVLLKPGRDRVPGPFDAVLAQGDGEIEGDGLRLDDDALAMAQISLRPRPQKAWTYAHVAMGWEKAEWPPQEINSEVSGVGVRKTHILRGYDLVLKASASTFEAMRTCDGKQVAVAPTSSMRIPVLSWPRGRVDKLVAEPSLDLLLRIPISAALDAGITLTLEARVVQTTAHPTPPGSGGTPPDAAQTAGSTAKERPLSLEELKALVPPEVSKKWPVFGVQSPGAAEGRFTFDTISAPTDARARPFERFGAIKPEGWAAMAAVPANVESGTPIGTEETQAAFASLLGNLRLALASFNWPGRDGKPTFEEYALVMSSYLAWSQRFLDHGAVPAEDSAKGPAATSVPYALAAPIKGQPWHLAADRDGRISLSFLHADRWAHARAYAVRPTPRYQNLALGAGYFPDQHDSERLVTQGLVKGDATNETFKQGIGYALAVSPRTERIEPPVIVGSGLAKRGDETAWELVVARHGEEALAFSNRSLFARLGTQGTALSFAREYREPRWPARLTAVMRTPVVADLYPGRVVNLPVVPTAASGIDGAALKDFAEKYPSLWKGADIWRIGQLPPHYRVTALAVARAGLVVSNVVSAVQDTLPRRSLNRQMGDANPNDKQLVGEPELELIRKGQAKVSLTLKNLRLVAHADVTVEAAKEWIGNTPNDIVWWPDPDVTYALVRQGRYEAGQFEDEEAVVRLVARPVSEDEKATMEPIVVRCRGPRYATKAGKTTADPPLVTTRTAAERSDFLLAFSLVRRSEAARERRVRFTDVKGWEHYRARFNKAAQNFAQLSASCRVIVTNLPTVPDNKDEAKQWLRDRGKEVAELAADLVHQTDPVNRELLAGLQAIAAGLSREADELTTIDPWQTVHVFLRRDRVAHVPLGAPPVDPVVHRADNRFRFDARVESLGEEVLRLFDLPANEEVDEVVNSLHPIASKVGGVLWRLCREDLLGAASGFKIRILDTRNAIVKNGDVWQTPGERVVDVEPPVWVGW